MQTGLVEFFRPEFLNRLDGIIGFHRLDKSHVTAILELQLQSIINKLKANQNLVLKLDQSAKDHLVESGFDPVFGARPLKRAIERELLNPLALMLLESNQQEISIIKVHLSKGALEFTA